ncbi:MAG: hypothetical protein ABI599_11105 [Flavobacteriales bacterium]
MPDFLELIADVGGSSSRWALLAENGNAVRLSGGHAVLPGFNPTVQSSGAFVEVLKATLRDALPAGAELDKLVVYGAGCGTDERKQRMRSALANIVPANEVVIETDLLGAARGLCADAPGLVLILGTGMNAGWFDGTVLQTPMPSLGWVLGDEGSGADIGKRLLADAVHGAIPPSLMPVVFGKDSLLASEALALISASASPSSAVAFYAGKLTTLEGEGYVRDLLADRFAALGSLLRKYFGSRAPCSISATGGIANGYSAMLRTSLAAFGFEIRKVEADPMEGLIAWHRRRLPR